MWQKRHLQGLTLELALMANANDILDRMARIRIHCLWGALSGGKSM
jgi:hypothetical protein